MIQAYQGGLMKQSGPSCWIFSVEAAADLYAPIYGNRYDTSLLAAIINLYPRDVVGSSKESQTRKEELRAVQKTLENLVAKLTNRAKAFDTVSRTDLRSAVAGAARDSLRYVISGKEPNLDMFMNIVFPQDGYYTISAVLAFLRNAIGLAGDLKDLAGVGNEEGELLGNRGMTYIGPTDGDRDVGLALEASIGGRVAVMGLKKRLSPGDYQHLYDRLTDTYDLTSVPTTAITKGGYHAVLVTSVNKGGKTLIYKDPNYGNSKIKISFAQLKTMAAAMTDGIELQGTPNPEHSTAKLPGILQRWGAVPTFTVSQTAPVSKFGPRAPKVKKPSGGTTTPVVTTPVVTTPVVTTPVVTTPVVTTPPVTTNQNESWGPLVWGGIGAAVLGGGWLLSQVFMKPDPARQSWPPNQAGRGLPPHPRPK